MELRAQGPSRDQSCGPPPSRHLLRAPPPLGQPRPHLFLPPPRTCSPPPARAPTRGQGKSCKQNSWHPSYGPSLESRRLNPWGVQTRLGTPLLSPRFSDLFRSHPKCVPPVLAAPAAPRALRTPRDPGPLNVLPRFMSLLALSLLGASCPGAHPTHPH